MASATDQGDKKMADEQDNEPEEQNPLPARTGGGDVIAPAKSGFFHIYKTGQGYWTRMLTAGGIALVTIFVAQFLYQQLPVLTPALQHNRAVHIGIVVGSIMAIALLAFWVMNKPRNADFLIATDSEMKKVNWTSRKELIGSTKVVVIFVFAVTILLFVIDLLFGYVFNKLHILQVNPLDALFPKK